MDEEIWKDVEDTNYEVSNLGRVRNKGTLFKSDSRGRGCRLQPHLLKNRLNLNGYYVTYNNKFIHRLVAKAFIPNIENKKEVNHIDGNKLNNIYSNLEWATRSENQKHAVQMGLCTFVCGENHTRSKLKESDVINIRQLYLEGNISHDQLAQQYNVRSSTIGKIIRREAWRQVK